MLPPRQSHVCSAWKLVPALALALTLAKSKHATCHVPAEYIPMLHVWKHGSETSGRHPVPCADIGMLMLT
jgi:hypothetical protein